MTNAVITVSGCQVINCFVWKGVCPKMYSQYIVVSTLKSAAFYCAPCSRSLGIRRKHETSGFSRKWMGCLRKQKSGSCPVSPNALWERWGILGDCHNTSVSLCRCIRKNWLWFEVRAFASLCNAINIAWWGVCGCGGVWGEGDLGAGVRATRSNGACPSWPLVNFVALLREG